MKKNTEPDLVLESEFYDVSFSDLNQSGNILQSKTFENCRFIGCNFSETQFKQCRIVDCEFNRCNLSAAQFEGSSLSNVIFNESKVIGVNWTKLKWPSIRLSSPFEFYKSNISHSNFYSLKLKELIVEECKAHDVDFREADLTEASMILTDFERTQFMHTKLYAADFTDAINYFINPNENDISKAKFSLPDVVNLLRGFDIEILE